MPKKIFIVVLFILTFLLTACESKNVTSSTTGTFPVQTTNPTAETTGISEEKPITLYYHLGPDGGLLKINSDGTGRQQVLDIGTISGGPCNVIIDNGWLYYKASPASDGYNGYKIRKIKLGSTETIKISDEEISSFIVEGDWIYFSTKDSFYINRMKTDGTEMRNITKKKTRDYCVLGDTLYFTVQKDFISSGLLYSINTDGSNEKNLQIEKAEGLKAAGDQLFYTIDNLLYSMNVNTLKSTRILDYPHSYDINAEHLIYIDGNHSLHVAGLDGSNDTIIANEKDYIYDAAIISNRIYFKVHNETISGYTLFYSINFDGSGKMQLPQISLDSDGFGIYVDD
jgi:hypothetical protein